jgi:hypothetical protein
MARRTESPRSRFEHTSPTEGSVAIEEGKSRRDVLKALGTAAAGVVAAGVVKTEDADASHGVINARSTDSRPAIHAENMTGTGAAIEAQTDLDYGTGIRVDASDGLEIFGYHRGIIARTTEFTCIEGTSFFGRGVVGTGPHGVVGFGTDSGASGEGVGVSGNSPVGIGVAGHSSEGIGGSFSGPIALQVAGSAKFSTAAAGSLPAGQDSVFVASSAVTAVSHITVTLTGDPGQVASTPGTKAVLVWVERRPGTGFVVHMSRPVRFTTPFTYLIVEPA